MNDYTPNTESVRESITYLAKYHAEGQYCDADLVVVESEVQGQFDRWLAEVERAVAEKAYEQGRLDERHDCKRFAEYQQGKITEEQYQRDARSSNPYRRERGGRVK